MYGLNDVAEALDVMTATGNHDIAVLQCTTLYPTPPADVNLRVMDSYRERFGGVIGYSDHTAGYHIPLAAVARGAMVVEKHITLDFNVPNAQDWKVSCGPHDLGLFISELREIERALGISEKVQSAAEADSVGWARKSLVVARPIAKGDVIVEDLLIAKRPGTGIAPSEIDAVIGKRASRVLDVDHALTWSDLT
jgi:N-acetylneuraminate synthase/N,N'-diacetyllegionaminate synthase